MEKDMLATALTRKFDNTPHCAEIHTLRNVVISVDIEQLMRLQPNAFVTFRQTLFHVRGQCASCSGLMASPVRGGILGDEVIISQSGTQHYSKMICQQCAPTKKL